MDETDSGGPGGEERYGDAERDEQHHPRLAAFQLADSTGEERGAAPGVHDGAEDCGDPARPAGDRVAQEHGEHGGERDHRDGDDQVDPEQPPELADVVAVARVTTAVMTVPGVVTVFHGVVFVLGARVVTVAGLGGRDAGVVMVMRGRVRHALRFPSSFPDLSFDRVVFRRGPSARPRRSAQEAGLSSLSTTHLWLVIVMPSDS